MKIQVAVAGASGYAGGELLRLLSGHPGVSIKTVAGASSAARTLGEVQPHLHSLADMVVQDTSAETLQGHDVVFLALPHGASASLAETLGPEVLVIDAGADFRLESASDWGQYYGGPHAGAWPYGLPELPRTGGERQRDRLRGARRVAVPGCYPTSAVLALAPGFAAGLLEPRDVVVVSASGASGAGRALKPHLLASEVMGSMSPYGVGGGHRHTPEIEQGLSWAAGEPVQVSFTPTLAPMPRGILTTATARLREGVTAGEVRAAWEEAYAGETFVRLLPEGAWPATSSVVGSNHVLMQLAVDERAGRVVVTAVVDNLTKGTAGAAVQAMNLALGLDETSGLPETGLAP
ncbi:N-acetyl-gamma-glutamyl-phosphate reductase [Falsarthrobacter nasiphocae]|uniref:N-acetyl-gamma-glutamyl-phosphate reductase n=1 Tax=Falsarthrobacter nasiphocae TaxID=189863 RepID=A0AAE4C8S3_9MICC|nr:N-acetyl-gamma-glutamyl-phosphate reductase [Falsarthrobacter nasiphocae]MDR6892705.1 N-acetyl-gamma-glutamyl-phosphate reductase [Falsarthrobacter nasiphocae]